MSKRFSRTATLRKPFDRKKLPPRSKKLQLVVRLMVEDLQVGKGSCVVTVVNAGTMPCLNGRIDLYRYGFNMRREESFPLTLTGSAPFTLGVMERKEIRVSKRTFEGLLNRYLAVAYDPLLDPFPTSRVNELVWQEVDLLHHDIDAWSQYSHRDAQGFANGSLVAAGNRSWTLDDRAPFRSLLPENDAVRRVYFPGTPPTGSGNSGANSELRQVIHLADQQHGDFLEEEAAKGNISVRIDSLLYNHAQTPRDQGAIGIELHNDDSPIAQGTAPLKSYTDWAAVPLTAGSDLRFNRVTARLLSHRRTGNNSDSYFANVRCLLKHRQVKRGGPFLIMRSVLAATDH